MKQPNSPAKGMNRPTPPTRERDQGSIKGSGINKPMVKESVNQVVARNKYGNITPTQKL